MGLFLMEAYSSVFRWDMFDFLVLKIEITELILYFSLCISIQRFTMSITTVMNKYALLQEKKSHVCSRTI